MQTENQELENTTIDYSMLEINFWEEFLDEDKEFAYYVEHTLSRNIDGSYAFPANSKKTFVGMLKNDMDEFLKDYNARLCSDISLTNDPEDYNSCHVYQLEDGEMLAVCEYNL